MEKIFRKVKNVLLRSGDKTWRNIEYFDPVWTARIKEMAKYVAPGRSVLDLGCGRMWLRPYIQASAYYPVDYVYRGEGTIVCDFNNGQFPSQKADVAFVSGTLEYIVEPTWFVGQISRNCTECVISYCTTEAHPEIKFRQKQAWKNNFSRLEIMDLFSVAGFKLAGESTQIPNNHIFYFKK